MKASAGGRPRRPGHPDPGTDRQTAAGGTAGQPRRLGPRAHRRRGARGRPLPDIASAGALRSTLLAAAEFSSRSAEGDRGHPFRPRARLGIRGEVEPHLKTYPNGATAMRELAQAKGEKLWLHAGDGNRTTPGVALVGSAAARIRTCTVYSAGLCRRCAPAVARRSRFPDRKLLRALRARVRAGTAYTKVTVAWSEKALIASERHDRAGSARSRSSGKRFDAASGARRRGKAMQYDMLEH